jgi:hypothetical protein
MAMSNREAVEIILAGRKAAGRIGQRFVPDHDRLRTFGLSANDIEQVELTVQLVEANRETLLAKLED